MFEDYQICPYTGLRSFTEEESLYFKGREDDIQHATEQLQRNKFLMLTGASGDGKSSLVYAGIIPNARAGFLKSKYTQWCVADFRPERTPFKNLSRAVAKQLEIANVDTVESELQHGFSALVDLYRNSRRFIDTDSIAWKNADEQGKAALKREGANLIILVDQFEEFFTNPENYHNGVPSRDSNLVLNVLLETARIALEENLPIYIVFTMRSDYIGQCAAFRSLPEYIGFSQFFVPRLNRSQLQQVIEEPASLSGNRISRRLTERLIHDIAEGVDQLPILQHALNQVWHSANKGSEEMDLIHYAMVGGMSVAELPDDQVDRFTKWFESLPEKIKPFYREPNLQNVLDTHANKLYESAAESYRRKTGGQLTDEDAKAIVKTAFTCLTKIDQSRAVRNRMTLLEISHILGKPELDVKVVGEVLHIFREPGNTFIRPFVTDEPESNTLENSDVLDITHESLIRNWEYLGTWAKEEFDNYSISLDYEKQLARWVDSGKNSGFLLSIGPLTYFESWYNKVNPNAWWIARYLPEDVDQSKKLEKANAVLDNSRQFLRLSARKHMVTRTIIRYGPRRIAAVLAVIGFLTLSSFMVIDYFRQQNAYVLKDIKERSLRLANSTKARSTFEVSGLMLEGVRSGSLTVDEIIDNIRDSIRKINLPARMAGDLALQGRNEPKKEILALFSGAEKQLSEYPFRKAKTKELRSILKEANYLRNAVGIAGVYNPSQELLGLRIKVAQHSAAIATHILAKQPTDFKDINALNVAIENGINYKTFTPAQVDGMIATLTPFENDKRTSWVLTSYSKESTATRGTTNYHFKFNGLFQELAYLYASKGNAAKALQCVDSLLFFNQGYYQNDYAGMLDNAANIAAVFYTYGEYAALDAFVRGYCERKKITEIEFYQRWIGRCLVYDVLTNPMFEFGEGVFINLNCQLSDDRMLAYLFSRRREFVNKLTKTPDELNYLLALTYKDEGVIRAHHQTLAFNVEMKKPFFLLLDTAFQHYRKVSPVFLNQMIGAMTTSDNDVKMVPRKSIFLFPDYRTTFMPFEPRQFFYSYSSSFFIEYLLERDLIQTYYNGEEASYFSTWLEALQRNISTFDYGSGYMRMKPDTGTLMELESELAAMNTSVDLNLLYLRLGNEVADRNNSELTSQYFRKLDRKRIPNLIQNTTQGLGNNIFRAIGFAVRNQCAMDSLKGAYALVSLFKKHENRASLYAFAAKKLLEQKMDKPIVQQLIDSAKMEITRIDEGSNFQAHLAPLSYAVSLQDPDRNMKEADLIVKNFGNKFWTSQQFTRSFAFHGKLYDAESAMIQNISDGDEAQYLWNILKGYAMGLAMDNPEWQEFERNYAVFANDFFFLADEN